MFALPHLYWGLGGREGVEATLGSVPTDPWFVAAATWGVAAVCAVGAGYGLALAQPRLRVPRILLRVLAVLAAAALLLHGAQDEIQFALLLAGVLHVEAHLQRVQILTQLLVWGPWFLLGGALLTLAAIALRRPRPAEPPPATR